MPSKAEAEKARTEYGPSHSGEGSTGGSKLGVQKMTSRPRAAGCGEWTGGDRARDIRHAGDCGNGASFRVYTPTLRKSGKPLANRARSDSA